MNPQSPQSILLTDSKALFLLYANPLHSSSTKIARWSDKLYSQYPNLKLRFLNTKLNIADYLSRNFAINTEDIPRIPLKNYVLPELEKHLDFEKEFTIPEWKEFVNKNLHLLKVVSTQPNNRTVYPLIKLFRILTNYWNPLMQLKNVFRLKILQSNKRNNLTTLLQNALNLQIKLVP